MSEIADIAQAVVDALNAHVFSVPFTAERDYTPTFELKDMRDLHVTVVARGVEMATASRAYAQNDWQVDVAVQKKIASPDASGQIDALMALVQDIAEHLRAVGTFGPGQWVRAENIPIYSPEHLNDMRQFTSVLTLTLRTVKACSRL